MPHVLTLDDLPPPRVSRSRVLPLDDLPPPPPLPRIALPDTVPPGFTPAPPSSTRVVTGQEPVEPPGHLPSPQDLVRGAARLGVGLAKGAVHAVASPLIAQTEYQEAVAAARRAAERSGSLRQENWTPDERTEFARHMTQGGWTSVEAATTYGPGAALVNAATGQVLRGIGRGARGAIGRAPASRVAAGALASPPLRAPVLETLDTALGRWRDRARALSEPVTGESGAQREFREIVAQRAERTVAQLEGVAIRATEGRVTATDLRMVRRAAVARATPRMRTRSPSLRVPPPTLLLRLDDLPPPRVEVPPSRPLPSPRPPEAAPTGGQPTLEDYLAARQEQDVGRVGTITDQARAMTRAREMAGQREQLTGEARRLHALAGETRPAYRTDLSAVAEETSTRHATEMEQFTLKSWKSVEANIERHGVIPTDMLRDTIEIDVPERLAAVVQSLERRGYRVSRLTNRFDDPAPGYKDINLRLTREGDEVVRELQLIQPAMLRMKRLAGHDLYVTDKALDLGQRVPAESAAPQVTLRRAMARLYEAAREEDSAAAAAASSAATRASRRPIVASASTVSASRAWPSLANVARSSTRGRLKQSSDPLSAQLSVMDQPPSSSSIPQPRGVRPGETGDIAVADFGAPRRPGAPVRMRVPSAPANVPTHWYDAARSAGGRLRQIAPAVMRMYDRADDLALTRAGRTKAEWLDSGIGRLPQQQRIEVAQVLEGQRSLASLSSEQARAYATMDRQRKQFETWARSVGFENFREEYFHHSIPPLSELATGKTRERILDQWQARGLASRAAMTKRLDEYLARIERVGREPSRQQQVQDLMQRKGLTRAEAEGKIARVSQPGRAQGFGALTRERSADFPFYEPDPLKAWETYITRAHKTIAEWEVMGKDLRRVDAALGRIPHAQRKDEAVGLWKTIRGATPEDPADARLLTNARRLATFLLNPLSSITNRSQIINNLLAGDTRSFVQGQARAFTQEGQRFALEAGVTLDPVLQETLEKLSSTGAKSRAWVKFIGFQRAERRNRIDAANVGDVYVQRRARQILKNPSNQTAIQELTRYGIDPRSVQAQGGLTYEQRLSGAKRFVDRTQQRGRASDLPAGATRSEFGKTFMQYKTFTYQQTQFLHEMIVQGFQTPGQRARAARAVLLLGTLYPLTGEVVADIRSLLSGRPRGGDQRFAGQTIPEKYRGLMRYLEDATSVGGAALIGDVFNATKYGTIPSFLLGPTFGRIAEHAGIAGEAAARSVAGKPPLTPSRQRQLIRDVPGIGAFAAPRLVPYRETRQP